MKSKEELKKQVEGLLKEGAALREAGDTRAGLSKLEEAKAILPQLNVDKGKFSNANTSANKGLDQILYLSRYANILYEIEEYGQALEYYGKLEQKLPGNCKVPKAQGDCWRKLGDYGKALEYYSKGLKMYQDAVSKILGDQVALLNSRGLLYIELGKYTQAIADFDGALKAGGNNPLYLCNKAHALHSQGQQVQALEIFRQVKELMASGKTFEGLSSQNLETINKSLGEFIDQLDSLNKIALKKPDMFTAKRESKFIATFIKQLAEAGKEENSKELAGIKDTKQKVAKLQNQADKAYEYYDGFLFTMSESYANSVIVHKGTFSIDTGSTKAEIAKQLLSLIPFAGSSIASAVEQANSFIKTAPIKASANNVCKFSTTGGDFDDLVQEVALQFAIEHTKALMELRPEEAILPNWIGRFNKLLKKYNLSELDLFGDRNETPMQKLGAQQATLLIEKYIATGKIYSNEPAIRMSAEAKRKVLSELAAEIFQDDIEGRTTFGEEKVQDTPSCRCDIFAVFDIVYDDPELVAELIKPQLMGSDTFADSF
jgi:tetratricopeptide (TPR) repeat protein